MTLVFVLGAELAENISGLCKKQRKRDRQCCLHTSYHIIVVESVNKARPDVCHRYGPLSPLEGKVLTPREAGQVEETRLLIKRVLGSLNRAGKTDCQALGVDHPPIWRESNESGDEALIPQ